MRKLITLSLLIFAANLCLAQTVIDAANSDYKNLGKSIVYFEDKTAKLNFEDVLQLPKHEFKQGKQEVFNGGTSGKTWWVKLKYKQQDNKPLFLILGYGNVDFIDIYYLDAQNKPKHIKSGTFANKGSRAVQTSEYVFELPDVGGEIKEVYIKAKSVNTLILPIKLANGITLSKAFVSKYLWQSLYIGIAFSILLFYIFLVLFTKQKVYALYLIRVFFLFYLYTLGYLNGYAHFFNSHVSKFMLIHAQAFAAIGFIATIYFNQSFLSLKGRRLRTTKWFKILVFLWVCVFIISIWDTRALTNRIAHVLLFVTSISIIYTSIKTFRNTDNSHRDKYFLIYLIGWIPSSLTTVYVLLTLVGVLPILDYTFELLNAACIVEAILMCLALIGDKFSILEKGKEKAEQEKIEMIKERNIFLEHKIKERTLELSLANEELKTSSAFKDKLFSIIAHDLRTPLSSLKMVLQLAEVKNIPQEQLNKLLTNIRKNTDQVQKTIDNLLHWSISQMKIQSYHPEHVDAKIFIQEHLNLYKSLADNKNISQALSCSSDIVLFVDKNQLSLILRNLIDNSIKFTPINGFIEIGITESLDEYTFYIKNSGTPISDEIIANITDGKAKLLNSSDGTGNERGIGLGLQLCKEFIQNLNSKLSIQNEIIDEITFTKFFFKIQK